MKHISGDCSVQISHSIGSFYEIFNELNGKLLKSNFIYI
nr:MAG TPA: hypothetical protein [Caudoviricetes sp.]